MKIIKLIGGDLIPSDIEKRIGKFRIDSGMVMTDFEAMARIMKNVVVIRADNDLASHTVEYIAMSPYFDVENETFYQPPFYYPTITMNNGHIIKVVWTKAKGEGSYAVQKEVKQ